MLQNVARKIYEFCRAHFVYTPVTRIVSILAVLLALLHIAIPQVTIISVHPLFLSAGAGGGLKRSTKFSRGDLTGSQFLEGCC